MDLKQQFHQLYPNAFFLEKNAKEVEKYLQTQGWLGIEELVISLEKPGDGNMNVVLRVSTNQRSFILKQARPWVEKFPQIAAPIERIAVEAQFFRMLENDPVINAYAPKYLGFDWDNFILATEDLGKGADYSFLYQKNKQLLPTDITSLMKYLSALHQFPTPNNFPSNLAMRELNHEHIFNFPFLVENGFNLDDIQEGLQAAAIPYKMNSALKKVIGDVGLIYLAKGKHLLHGDFYPGSWLKVEGGLKVIDPEFGFVGPAAFDLGVLLAHLVMAEQSNEVLQMVLSNYKNFSNLNEALLAKFAGIEILRRLIGIAQLPLNLDINTKKKMMERAANWIMLGKLDFV